MKLLLVAATPAEIAPTLDFLTANYGGAQQNIFEVNGHLVEVLYTGVGLMAATFALTGKLLSASFDFVLQAGIAGAYDQRITLGSLLAIKSEALGDLGAEDHEDLIDVFHLGFADPDQFPFASGRLENPMASLPFFQQLPVATALTVHLGGGHAATIDRRIRLFGAGVESMEGAALHYVCLQINVPFLQLRAISNHVTPRDRDAWKIGLAVKNLNDALIDELDRL